MKINITAGQIANDILQTHYEGYFIPFNEAMIQGHPIPTIFSDEFIEERCITHATTQKSYRKVMKEFLDFTLTLHHYSKITCWFGTDDFCKLNLITLLAYLKQENYQGKVTTILFDEETYEILQNEQEVKLDEAYNTYLETFSLSN